MKISNTKKLLIALAVLICFIYIRFYLSSSPISKIIQLSVSELTPAILMQKHPIIIDEPLVNPISLLHTVFKYMYVYKKVNEVIREDKSSTNAGELLFKQNKSRYLIITCKSSKSSVQILNPRLVATSTNEEESNIPPYIDVKLYENMCMILPFNWWFRIKNPKDVSSIALEDIMSLTFGRLIS